MTEIPIKTLADKLHTHNTTEEGVASREAHIITKNMIFVNNPHMSSNSAKCRHLYIVKQQYICMVI